jgi:hypothetical protein
MRPLVQPSPVPECMPLHWPPQQHLSQHTLKVSATHFKSLASFSTKTRNALKPWIPEHALDSIRIRLEPHALVEVNNLGICKECDVADALP